MTQDRSLTNEEFWNVAEATLSRAVAKKKLAAFTKADVEFLIRAAQRRAEGATSFGPRYEQLVGLGLYEGLEDVIARNGAQVPESGVKHDQH